ncbi:MAG: hypothetical protein EHM45_24900 [Desulfobacteraceae bacterium]|nr:MAG: hypothetical protein EHM45_24900 [Desulfobacteraceae bacterium]
MRNISDFFVVDLPVRNGEGKFYAKADILATLQENHLVAARYADAAGAVAGGKFPRRIIE